MKKITIVSLLIALSFMLILSGCGGGTDVSNDNPYVGGEEALLMSFQEGQPPEEIFDQGTTTFLVGMILENRGEHSIEYDSAFDYGRLTLRGVNPPDYGITLRDLIVEFNDPEKEISIQGFVKQSVDNTIIQGGMQSVTFPIMSYQNDLQGNTQVNLGVDLCYNYKTKSSTSICFVDDIQNANNRCDPYGEKITMNSGGPVHVKSVTQGYVGGDKLHLTILLSKVNSEGTVFNKIDKTSITWEDSVCADTLTNTNKNKVFVEVYTPSANTVIKCSEFSNAAEGTVTLTGGKDKVLSCSIDVEETIQDYETPLYIDLSYSYGQYMEKEITIKDYQ